MSGVQRIDGPEIAQDLRYQRREWAFERVGWCIMLLLVVAALLGLFGVGPLSDAASESAGGALRVEYERFARSHSHTALRVHARADPGGEFRLRISREYLEGVRILEVSPPPVRVETDGTGNGFVFAAAEGVRSATFVFRVEPQQAGSLRGEVAAGDASVEFGHFVYP